ncbi:MAG TPA: hypothetical protein PLC53_01485 [Bacilli bacterium]|mgnify:CR=1 FL=1|nr:hypothetical protein [Bacilli bacterium]
MENKKLTTRDVLESFNSPGIIFRPFELIQIGREIQRKENNERHAIVY